MSVGVGRPIREAMLAPMGVLVIPQLVTYRRVEPMLQSQLLKEGRRNRTAGGSLVDGYHEELGLVAKRIRCWLRSATLRESSPTEHVSADETPKRVLLYRTAIYLDRQHTS